MFLLIDNYDSFTWNLAQAFQSLGKNPVTLKNDDPQILKLAVDPDLEMVCISPGPGHPAKAGLCPEFLKLLNPDIPVLGICLGHQLLGLHGGGKIEIAPVIMHGKQSEIDHNEEGMFDGLPWPLTVGRYHSLAVAVDEGADVKFNITATGPAGEIMALQYKDRPWAGAQFHPESVLTPEGLRFLANFPEGLRPAARTPFNQILEKLANKEDLPREMAKQAFSSLLDGELTPAQAGAFLFSLRAKGESGLELAQAVKGALARAVPVKKLPAGCLDIVGTGGDGKNSFNCSTAAALTLAGMGYKIAKHGNRAVSSTCGAADAIEGLGLPIPPDAKTAVEQLEQNNFTFFFAPYFHPSFKNIGPIRRELGCRTLFNILGPMINPGKPDYLVMGVARPELTPLVADTLRHSRHKRAAVFHGAGGYDEITTMGPTEVTLIKNGDVSRFTINPARYGMEPATPEELACANRDEAVAALRGIFAGKGKKAMSDMVILNVALAIYLLDDLDNFDIAVEKAAKAVKSGAGQKALRNAR